MHHPDHAATIILRLTCLHPEQLCTVVKGGGDEHWVAIHNLQHRGPPQNDGRGVELLFDTPRSSMYIVDSSNHGVPDALIDTDKQFVFDQSVQCGTLTKTQLELCFLNYAFQRGRLWKAPHTRDQDHRKVQNPKPLRHAV